MSDLHCRLANDPTESSLEVGSLRIPGAYHPVEALLELIDQRNLSADALLVPGDLANRASREGLYQGWEFAMEVGRKVAVPNLNPMEPADREKIAREITKFFADPGRKYKQELQKQESTIQELVEENVELEKRQSNQEEEHRQQKEQLALQMSEQESTVTDLQQQLLISRLRTSAFLRLFWLLAGWILTEAAVIYAVVHFGEGENLLQQLVKAWVIVLAPVGLWIVAAWFVLGKARISALGFPFSAILKSPEEYLESPED